jgi:hypothetical protein
MSPDEIDERMKLVEIKMLRLQHDAKAERTSRYWKSARAHLRVLRKNGFGTKAIKIAINNPKGRVALTLRYGRKRAEEIMRKRRYDYAKNRWSRKL